MKKTRRGYGLAVTLVVLCAMSTACGGGGEPLVPAVTETEAPVYDPVPSDPTSPWEDDKVAADPFTALVVRLAWQVQEDAEKQGFCEGLEVFGPEVVADFFRYKAKEHSGESVDEDLAVEMLEDRCREEGYLPS